MVIPFKDDRKKLVPSLTLYFF